MVEDSILHVVISDQFAHYVKSWVAAWNNICSQKYFLPFGNNGKQQLELCVYEREREREREGEREREVKCMYMYAFTLHTYTF